MKCKECHQDLDMNCDQCGSPLTEKVNRHDQSRFWGCPRWPACKHLGYKPPIDYPTEPEYMTRDEIDEDLDEYDAMTGGVTFGDQD